MKKVFFLSFISIVFACLGQNKRAFLFKDYYASSGPAYLIREKFEGPGYQYTWAEAGTVAQIDDQYATAPAPLQGSYSLALNTTATSTRTTNLFGSELPEFNWSALVRFQTLPSSGKVWLQVQSSGTNVFTVEQRGATNSVIIRMGSANAITAGTLNAGVTYRVWARYAPATSGANAFGDFGFSEDGTRPSSGTNYCSSSVGATAGNPSAMQVGSFNNTTMFLILDDWIVSTNSIGNNP